MTPEQVGIYMRFLLYQFRYGSVPDDLETQRRIAQVTTVEGEKPMGFVLVSKFCKIDGVYVNERMSETREKTVNRYNANIENGRKGGRPKKLQKSKSKNPGVSFGVTQIKPNGKGEVGRGMTSNGSIFDDFWSLVPSHKKRSKGDARKAFEKASTKVDTSILLEAYSAYATSDEGRTEFASMPSAWLNQERWKDDPDAWKRNGNGQRTLGPDFGV